MKNIKKVAYIFTLFAISSNLCFPDSPLDEQDGLVFGNNKQRSIVQSFKDADNDEKAAWALTGVSALGVIFAAIGYKFYDSTKKTKPLENFIVIKGPGKDGKVSEREIPVYEKISGVPKDKAIFNNIVFVKDKKGGFMLFRYVTRNKNKAVGLRWVPEQKLSLYFGHAETPIVESGDADLDLFADPAPAEEFVFDWSADGLEFPADAVANPVEGSVIVPPAPAADSDSVSEEEDGAGDDSAVDPVVVVTPVPTDLAPAAASTGSPKDGSPIKKRSIKCKILGFFVATLSVAITIGALSAPYFMPPLSARHIDDSYKPNLHIGMPPCWPDQEPGYVIPWSPCNSVYSRRHPEQRCWKPEDMTPTRLRDDGHYRSIHSSAY